jgi:hypothetical protein
MQIAGQAMRDLVASCNDVVVLHRSSYILQPRLNLMRQTLTILDDIVLYAVELPDTHATKKS